MGLKSKWTENIIAYTNIKISYFRMEHNNALNVSCNFNGYLVCQIPKNMVEVELKIKTTRGKYTLNKDTYTRTERYHPWDRADRRAQIHTKKRRIPRRETFHIDTPIYSTNSETDIQDGKGFACAPKVFSNPEYVATLPQMETESSELEVTPNKFIGEYCEKYVKWYNRYQCDKSDWDEELMEIELPKAPTNNQNNTTNNTK